MKSIIEVLDRFTAIQIIAALLGLTGAVLFVYGLIMMFARSVRAIVRRLSYRQRIMPAGNYFKPTATEKETVEFKDALVSMTLLIALVVIIVALSHSK